MMKLTKQVLHVFEKEGKEVVPYYATNTESAIKELNISILELISSGVIPQLVNVNSETLELNFVKANEEILGCIKGLNEKMLNLENLMKSE